MWAIESTLPMKIKHQLTLFSITTKLVIIVLFWFSLPILIEKVVYANIDKSLNEKKQKFIQHLDKEEISDFLTRKDTSETYSSFSNLHSEFLQLYQIKKAINASHPLLKNEKRVIEEEESNYRILYFDFSYNSAHYRLEIGNSLSEIEDLIYVIRIFILIVLILSIVLTFVSETFFIEYLFKPFNKIINEKIKYTNEPESFNLNTIHTHSSDFQELDEGLNQMMLKIQETFAKEKQFIANVSHELLTPIALLKNRFENLMQNESLNEKAIDKMVASLKTLDMLKKIINNLLLISKIDNNQYLTNEKVSLTEILEDVITELEDRSNDKHIAFSKTRLNDPYFQGNKTLLHVMFFNVLANAIKYNRKNGLITITEETTENSYVLKIKNTGDGMTPEQIATVFDRFSRINFNEEGQGLGLAIVKSIAQLHHIKIQIESELNQYTVLIFSFPIAV